MSWHVFFMNIPEGINKFSEIPDDFKYLYLGSHSEVVELMTEFFPGVKFYDLEWGVLDTEDYSIEFSIGQDDPVDSVMLDIRGSEAPVDNIRKLCMKTSWKAINSSSGDFMDFDNRNPDEGFNEWKRYRDTVIGSN